jgi:hypothetical protein
MRTAFARRTSRWSTTANRHEDLWPGRRLAIAGDQASHGVEPLPRFPSLGWQMFRPALAGAREPIMLLPVLVRLAIFVFALAKRSEGSAEARAGKLAGPEGAGGCPHPARIRARGS